MQPKLSISAYTLEIICIIIIIIYVQPYISFHPASKRLYFFSSLSTVQNPESFNLIGLSRALQWSGLSHVDPEYRALWNFQF